MTLQCCVCKKVNIDGSWVYDGHGGRADASHTYCPYCLKDSVTELAYERRRADLVEAPGT